MNNTIRIIGGLYRGRKISFPTSEHLRPTPDRVKETVFNWLMHDIKQARCLDAFAGSGSLGFEALSRGASNVVLVEADYPVFRSLKKNADSFNSSALHVIHDDAHHFLQTSSQIFDIIFLDPPFQKEYYPQVINLLQQNACLRTGGLLYIESPHSLVLDSTYWLLRKQKQSGQVVYALYEKG